MYFIVFDFKQLRDIYRSLWFLIFVKHSHTLFILSDAQYFAVTFIRRVFLQVIKVILGCTISMKRTCKAKISRKQRP